MSSDDFTVYGVCQQPGCGYVWLEPWDPWDPINDSCPRCGFCEHPLSPQEAERRRALRASVRDLEGSVCKQCGIGVLRAPSLQAKPNQLACDRCSVLHTVTRPTAPLALTSSPDEHGYFRFRLPGPVPVVSPSAAPGFPMKYDWPRIVEERETIKLEALEAIERAQQEAKELEEEEGGP